MQSYQPVKVVTTDQRRFIVIFIYCIYNSICIVNIVVLVILFLPKYITYFNFIEQIFFNIKILFEISFFGQIIL